MEFNYVLGASEALVLYFLEEFVFLGEITSIFKFNINVNKKNIKISVEDLRKRV